MDSLSINITQQVISHSVLINQNAQDLSPYSMTNHNHGGLSLVNLTGSSASNGLTLSANTAGGGGAAIKGSGIYSQNTGTIEFANSNGITFGLTNNQMTAQHNGLTTAMQSDAGSNFIGIATAGTNVSLTANSSGLSLSIPNYLTTAMASENTSLFQYTSATSAITASAMNTSERASLQYTSANTKFAGILTTGITGGSATINSSQVQINLPAYLTTAMQSASSSVFAKTGFTSASTAGTDIVATLNTNGLSVGVPKWITTAAAGGIAASIGGNSTSAGAGYSNITSGTMVIMGGNNITLSQNGASITISAANAGGAQTGISGVGVSNTTYTSGTVIYSADANLTIASSVNGVSQYVKFSVGPYITTAALSQNTSNYAGINGGITGGSLTVNTSGITISLPAYLTTAMVSDNTSVFQYTSANTKFAGILTTGVTGASATINSSQIQLNLPAYLTTAMQSGSSSVFAKTGFTTASTAGSDLVGTHNTDGLNLGVPKWLTTAALSANTSNYAGVSSGTQSTAGSDLVMTHNTAGLNLGVPKWLTTAMQSGSSSVFAKTGFTTASTAGSDIVGTHDTAGLNLGIPKWLTTAMQSGSSSVFAKTGFTTASTAGVNLVGTLNTDGLSLGVPAWLTAAAGGGGVAIAGSAASTVTSGTVQFANSNGISFGLNVSTMTASIDGVGSVYFGNANGISFGTSVNGVSTSVTGSINLSAGINGVGVTGSTNAITSGNVVFSGSNLTITTSANAGTNYIQINVPDGETLSEYHFFDQIAPVTNNSSIFGNSSLYLVPLDVPQPLFAQRINFFNSIAYTSSNASTITMSMSYMAGIYQRDSGTNSTNMTRLWSGEAYFGLQAEATSASVIHPNGFNNSTSISYSTYQNAAAGSGQTTYFRNSVVGLRVMQIPISSTMTPGHYYLAFGMKSTHGTGTASWNFRISHHYQSLTHVGYVRWGEQSVASNATAAKPAWRMVGSFSAQTASPPVTIAMNATAIKMMTNMVWPLFNISGWATNASNI